MDFVGRFYPLFIFTHICYQNINKFEMCNGLNQLHMKIISHELVNFGYKKTLIPSPHE